LVASGGGAGQGIAAQLALPHREQPFGRGSDQGGSVALLPQKAAAAALVTSQRGQQLQGVGGCVEAEFLAHGQHHFVQFAPVDPRQGLLYSGAVALLPAGAPAEAHPLGGLPIGRARIRHQPLQAAGLFPELFGQLSGRHPAADGALQPQPAMLALAAELPAGQHGLHARHATRFALQGRIEEGEGQEHPGAGQGRPQGGGGQAAEAGTGKALGQLEASGAAQFQAVGAAGGGDAEPRRSVPEKAEAVASGGFELG
jgi:hypothetical protein